MLDFFLDCDSLRIEYLPGSICQARRIFHHLIHVPLIQCQLAFPLSIVTDLGRLHSINRPFRIVPVCYLSENPSRSPVSLCIVLNVDVNLDGSKVMIKRRIREPENGKNNTLLWTRRQDMACKMVLPGNLQL